MPRRFSASTFSASALRIWSSWTMAFLWRPISTYASASERRAVRPPGQLQRLSPEAHRLIHRAALVVRQAKIVERFFDRGSRVSGDWKISIAFSRSPCSAQLKIDAQRHVSVSRASAFCHSRMASSIWPSLAQGPGPAPRGSRRSEPAGRAVERRPSRPSPPAPPGACLLYPRAPVRATWWWTPAQSGRTPGQREW